MGNVIQSQTSGSKKTKTWKSYHKYLRKDIYPSAEIVQNLDGWFVRYKCTASPGQEPAGGRLDPKTGRPLFGPDTKDAVLNNTKTSCYLQDVLPLEKMYRKKDPPKRSKRDVHQLCTYKSDRGESRLEAFHDEEAHLANTNMREALSDSVNLEGTARWNVQVRERNRFDSLTADECAGVPLFFHREPLHFNESDLAVVNCMAAEVGIKQDVHPDVRPLPEDNGERFFSAYYREQQKRNETLVPHPLNDRCQCEKCANNPLPLPNVTAPPPQAVKMVVQQPKKKKVSKKRKVEEYTLTPPGGMMVPQILPSLGHFWPNLMAQVQPDPVQAMAQLQLANLYQQQQQQMMVLQPPQKVRKRQEEYWCQGCFKWNMKGRMGRRPKACKCRK